MAKRKPLIGLIVPPKEPLLPLEGPQLYGDQVAFEVRGLGLKAMKPEGYDSVIGKVADAAADLARAGAQAVALMGTSLSFYQGAAFNERLKETMRVSTGLPVTTMSTAVVEALRLVRAKRLAVGTAYADEVNERLQGFLGASGFEVASMVGMGIRPVEGVAAVTPNDLLELGARAFGKAERADALLISCGGLRTLSVTVPLEEQCAVPVVSSSPAGFWAAVRLVGLSGASPGYGRLFSEELAHPLA